MKHLYSIIILILILCTSCNNKRNENNQNIELNCTSDVKYIKRNGKIESTLIDFILMDQSRREKIQFITKNDTMFVVKANKNIYKNNNRIEIRITSKIYSSTELSCLKKVIIHQNEIRYTFCYSDIIDFFDKKTRNLKDYNKYEHYQSSFLNQISEEEEEAIFYCDEIIIEFIMNLPFSVYDKYSRLEVPKIITSQYNGLWHGGFEYFLLDKKNDTIASHGFNEWIQ